MNLIHLFLIMGAIALVAWIGTAIYFKNTEGRFL